MCLIRLLSTTMIYKQEDIEDQFFMMKTILITRIPHMTYQPVPFPAFNIVGIV